jgi:hypothetical protein
VYPALQQDRHADEALAPHGGDLDPAVVVRRAQKRAHRIDGEEDVRDRLADVVQELAMLEDDVCGDVRQRSLVVVGQRGDQHVAAQLLVLGGLHASAATPR